MMHLKAYISVQGSGMHGWMDDCLLGKRLGFSVMLGELLLFRVSNAKEKFWQLAG
jgi:hypothetical protein